MRSRRGGHHVAPVAVAVRRSLPCRSPSLRSRALTQPNGTAIPSARRLQRRHADRPRRASSPASARRPASATSARPVPAAPTTCDDGKHATCETTMWHAPNDNSCIPSLLSGLDPVADAQTTPETFHPTCGLTFTVVSRGARALPQRLRLVQRRPAAARRRRATCTSCSTATRRPAPPWSSTCAPTPPTRAATSASSWSRPRTTPPRAAAPAATAAPTVARLGGGVGYVYYSQRAFNPDGGGATPYIHLLTYRQQARAAEVLLRLGGHLRATSNTTSPIS